MYRLCSRVTVTTNRPCVSPVLSSRYNWCYLCYHQCITDVTCAPVLSSRYHWYHLCNHPGIIGITCAITHVSLVSPVQSSRYHWYHLCYHSGITGITCTIIQVSLVSPVLSPRYLCNEKISGWRHYTLHLVEVFPSRRCVSFPAGLSVPPVGTSHLTTATACTQELMINLPLKHRTEYILWPTTEMTTL